MLTSMVTKFWTCNPISFKHMAFWCFLDLAPNHGNRMRPAYFYVHQMKCFARNLFFLQWYQLVLLFNSLGRKNFPQFAYCLYTGHVVVKVVYLYLCFPSHVLDKVHHRMSFELLCYDRCFQQSKKFSYVDVYICSASAQSVETMIFGRFLVGVGIGVNTGLVPMYISEVLVLSVTMFSSILLVLHDSILLYLCTFHHLQELVNMYLMCNFDSGSPYKI